MYITKSLTVPCSNAAYHYLLSPQGVGSPQGTCGSQIQKELTFKCWAILMWYTKLLCNINAVVTQALTVLMPSQCHAPPRKPSTLQSLVCESILI